jgi:hypothetical protein
MPGGVLSAAGAVSVQVNVSGLVTMSLSGTWVAMVVLERSVDDVVNFNIVETFTRNHEAHVRGTGEVFRLRVTNFDSGTIIYFLGKPG